MEEINSKREKVHGSLLKAGKKLTMEMISFFEKIKVIYFETDKHQSDYLYSEHFEDFSDTYYFRLKEHTKEIMKKNKKFISSLIREFQGFYEDKEKSNENLKRLKRKFNADLDKKMLEIEKNQSQKYFFNNSDLENPNKREELRARVDKFVDEFFANGSGDRHLTRHNNIMMELDEQRIKARKEWEIQGRNPEIKELGRMSDKVSQVVGLDEEIEIKVIERVTVRNQILNLIEIPSGEDQGKNIFLRKNFIFLENDFNL